MEAIGVEAILPVELPMVVKAEAEKKLTVEATEAYTGKKVTSEEEEEAINNNDRDNNNDTTMAVLSAKIVKGKRTKRQRVQSPVMNSFVAPASSNSSNGDDDIDDGGRDDDDVDYNFNEDDDDEDEVIMARPLSILPPPPSSLPLLITDGGITKEEEDTANCLILLAQGNSFIANNHITVAINNNGNNNNGGKFTSRKYMEADSGVDGGGKIGYYVYECKTCNRTFPSFQALGGHRASHKKPKNIMSINSNNNYGNRFLAANNDDNNMNFLQLGNCVTNGYSNNKGNNHNSNYNRVHECGQCGAEFNSGQALGGHMRRHRVLPSVTTTTVSSLISTNNNGNFKYGSNVTKDEESQILGKRGRSLRTASLDLDLNQLPAPEEKLQQQHMTNLQPNKPTLVFPSPALVDCHY